MADKHPGYMTTFKERLSYWTYFIGQNIYYNITAAFISTYLAMQGVNLAKVAIVLLIVKIWDAVNDPIFGFIFDKVKFKNGQKSLPWLRISTALIPIVTIILFSIPSALGETGKLDILHRAEHLLQHHGSFYFHLPCHAGREPCQGRYRAADRQDLGRRE